MTGISRRNLLKGAAFSAAGVAALGLAGCAPQTEATKAEAGLAETGETAKHTWEVKPEPIAADQISQTVDTEVLVIGGGYSGSCCALSAAQNGAKTILVEKDAVLNGHGVGGTGAIASRALDDLGLKFDKSLEMERWVSTCGNRCRESLVGKWFRESERCMNWFLDLAEKNGAKCMVTVGSRSVVHPEIDCYHMISGGEIFEQHTMADFVEYLFFTEQALEMPNRTACDLYIKNNTERVLGDDNVCVVLELTNLSHINNELGRVKGNEVLRRFADFIKEASATCGTVYYNGGWQFIGFFEQCRREDAESFADYMHRLVHAYNEESGDAKMEYSLGMAESRTANAHTLRTLLRGAMMDRRKQED